MKPVALFEYQMLNNTKGGDMVLDSFGGSGTTLIAAEKNGGGIGMKIYVRGFTSKLTFYTSMEAFFRYALSQPIATAVIGCDTLEQLEQNVYFARSFRTMDWEEQDGFVDAIAPFAQMYYKSQYYEKDR
jgi:hypothetical protein